VPCAVIATRALMRQSSIDRLNANEMERLTEAELEEARKPLSGNQ